MTVWLYALILKVCFYFYICGVDSGTVEFLLYVLVVDPSSDDDCVLVEVKLPQEELVKKALSLQLPPTFYNYLDMPECPGCIGCRSPSELQTAKVPFTVTGIYRLNVLLLCLPL